MRTLLLRAALAVAAALVATGHEHASCAVDEDGRGLTCNYRLLTRDVAAVAADRKVAALRVRCNRDVLAESVLRANHFGYLAHVKSLDVDACKIRRVPALAFSGLTSLTSLALTSGWSSVAMDVEAEAFTGLHHLRTLNLSSNGIRALSPSTYCSLASLSNLDVSKNAIRDVVSLGFSDQAVSKCRLPLDTIDLSGNGFDSVPNGAFGQLFSLKRLNLEANFITTMEERSLSSLIFLQKLSLAHNRLSNLPPSLFSETVSLVDLNLQNNSLSVLPPGVLSPLRNLLLLNLSRNALTSDHMDAATFSGLGSLRALDLSFNRLSKIDRHLFSGLEALEILDLSHNALRLLSELSALPRLHSLSASHNLLQSLSSVCGPSLSYLSLNHNILADLSQANCSSLQDLSLSGNRLRRLPAIVRNLPQIKTLDVSQNSIGELRTGDLQGLQHLTALSLASNGISALDSNVFDGLLELEVLNLSDNLLDKLNGSLFVQLTTLRWLRLDSNLLEDINGVLTTNAELQWLNISSNRIAWFDYGSIPRSVRWLDVSRNRLEDLSNYYGTSGEGYSLEHLFAAHNAISSLGPTSVLDGMQTIDLGHNEIAKVEAHTFEAKTKLRRVMLNDNKLTKLDTSSLATRGTLAFPFFF
jgi:Leucine-rich repeat (LRR) protein